MSLFGNKSKFQKVAALVGKEQVTEEDIKAANEELEAEGVKGAMLISLQDAETAKGLATQLEQATTKANSLEKQLEEMTAARDAIQAKFNARPGAEGTEVKVEQDKIEGAANADKVVDPEAEHNKTAAEFLRKAGVKD